MAQDNPFLNLFESIGAGMEAGQRRRNLMERARQGEISPQEVPGLGMTALMGAVRAATPASTRLAQDQLKLQIANQALDEQIFEAKQQAAEAEKIALKTKASKEARAERDNSILFADITSRADEFLATGQFEKMAGLRKEAENLPVAQQVQFNSVVNTLSDTYKADDFIEFKRNKGYLEERLSPEELASLTPPEAKRMSDVFFGRPISNIGSMVSDYESYNARGATNAAQLVLASIKKNTEKTGQVVDVSPEGRVTIREEVIGGPDKDLSVAEQAALNKSERVYKEVRPFIDQALRLVTENPDSFGSSGELTGLTNRMKSLLGVIPFVEFKQDMTRREVETSINTLIGKTLPALAGTSLGRMTENDAKLLKAPLPKLDVFNPAEVVKQQLETLDFRVSLAYILDQQKRGTIAEVLDNEGPVEFAKIMSRANKEGFGSQERTVLRAIDEAVTHISSNPNMQDADSDIKALFMELGASGQFNDAELQLILDNVPQG